MHQTQEHLLRFAEQHDLSKIPLRKIAEMLNKPGMSPGVLQHHFSQLEKKSLLFVDRKTKTQQLGAEESDKRFYSIPIVGAASCGPANQLADERVEGYLTVSKNVVTKNGKLFAVRAVGDSMNNAKVRTPSGDKAPIKDGDYAIVDTSLIAIEDNLNKYVVSIINSMANIKRLTKREYDYALISESLSQSSYPPIIIHQDDDCVINGQVIAVVKG